MVKRIMNDVIPEHNSAHSEIMDNSKPNFLARRAPVRYDNFAPSRKSKSFWPWLILFLLIIALGAFGLSTFFAKANINVEIRSEELDVDTTITLNNVVGATTRPAYKIISITEDAEKTLAATGKKVVEKKAAGTITVYNEFSSKPYSLVKNTRFQTEDGKIYRISSGITIPGYKNNNGSVTAGTIDAQVVADAPGASFNITDARFTLPGLQGKEEFNKIYAKTKTAISGGVSGEVYVVTDSDRRSAETTLRNELEALLRQRSEAEIPEGYILVPDVTKIVLSSVEENSTVGNDSGPEGSVKLLQRGTASLVVVPRDDVAYSIAQKYISDYSGEDVYLDDNFASNSLIEFSAVDAARFDVDSSDTLLLSINGQVKINWDYDKTALIQSLLGKNKKDYQSVFVSYPMIERAEITVRPPWKSTFPSNPDRINIIESSGSR